MEPNRKNPVEIRNKIISLMKIRGPCLPVHISRETNLDLLFSSAFLSELASESIIKISSMKVGGSPLYFLPGQEEQLEKFYTYLPGKEKEAFLLLKNKGVLEDIKLEPAIRVALRNLKDFSYPLVPKIDEKTLFWKFHSLPIEKASEIIENILELKKPKIEIKEIEKTLPETAKEKISEIEMKKPEEKPEKLKTLDIFDKIQEKPKRARQSPESFLNEIKNFLANKNIQILSQESYNKKEVVARVRVDNQDRLLIALNKKRINEKELVKAYKKALTHSLPYMIITRDFPPKKIKEFLDAGRNLKSIEKI